MKSFEEWARVHGCRHAIVGGPVPGFYQALGYQQAGLFFVKAL
jgi:hypothetical protein